jgi:hypothetical protein
MGADSVHAQSAVPNIRTGDSSPTVANSRPTQTKPDVVNGLDWYLIGRGFAND